MIQRRLEQLSSHGRVRRQTTTPHELLLLLLELQTRNEGTISLELAIIDSRYATANFVVWADLDLGPGPVSEIGHQPD
jgi:hypothetical protein